MVLASGTMLTRSGDHARSKTMSSEVSPSSHQ